LIDPFSAQSDTNYLTLRESSPCAPTTRPVVDDIDLSKASTGQGGPFHTYSTPLSSRSALRTYLDLVAFRHLGRPDVSRVSSGYGAAVVLEGHVGRLPVVPPVNEPDVPARTPSTRKENNQV